MGKTGKISTLKKEYNNSQLQTMQGGLAMKGMTRIPGTGVFRYPYKELDGKYYHDYSDDASWGPRMVGQEYIPWYAWYSGHDRSNKTAKLTPQPNNARDFFQTGLFLNNSVAVSKVTDKINLRVSLGNIDVKGLLPTSTLKKNTFNLIIRSTSLGAL